MLNLIELTTKSQLVNQLTQIQCIPDQKHRKHGC